ncbi:MAG: D-alanyl-D-alanine carboxypeptidase/D-alanyl-D-alanine endopeptidase [Longimicrobiales bacterium]
MFDVGSCRPRRAAATLLLLAGCAPAAREAGSPVLIGAPAESAPAQPAPAQPAQAQPPPAQPTPPPAPAPDLYLDLPLSEAIERITSEPPLDLTHWGIQVYDPRRDRTLVCMNARKHFVPASNNKLLVTTAALELLGPDWRYVTEVDALGGTRPAPAALRVRAVGDPTMSERFYPTELAALDSIAAAVAAAGVRRIAGPILVDASAFDSTLVMSAWEVGDLDWYYAAPVAAFGVSEGAIPLIVSPGATVGEPARIEFQGPPGLVAIRGEIVTIHPDSSDDWDVRRLPGDTLIFSGTLEADADADEEWVAVDDPAAYGARALRLALEAHGVRVDGGVLAVYDSAAAAGLADRFGAPRRVARIVSPPMSRIAQAILEPSQNWIAEMVLKTLGRQTGRQGSWRGGLAAVDSFLVQTVGIDSLAFDLRDASGLSAQNLVTPGMIVDLLAWARLRPWGDLYLDALAAPGEEESTLEHRLLAFEGRLFGKTGTIANVNSLSGYLVDDAGGELIFSILTNGSGLPSSRIRDAMDRVVERIAREGGR